MAWTHLTNSASVNTGTAASLSLGYPGAVTAGDLLVVVAFVHGGATSATVTDTAGNTWTQAVSSAKNATDGSFIVIFYAVASASGATTVTLTPSSGTPGMALAIHEFSPGTPATSFTITLDGSNSAVFTSNTGAPSAGSIPINSAGELVVAAIGEGSAAWSGTYTAGTGFTLDQSVATSPTIGTEYDLSASAAIAGAFTTSQIRPWDAVGASFKAASGGAAVQQMLTLLGCGA